MHPEIADLILERGHAFSFDQGEEQRLQDLTLVMEGDAIDLNHQNLEVILLLPASMHKFLLLIKFLGGKAFPVTGAKVAGTPPSAGRPRNTPKSESADREGH